MEGLTIGQRIDVYEVVANHGQYQWKHSYKLQTQIAIGHTDDTEFPICPLDGNMEALQINEVKKCGYYLKVKSLKGGSNA